MSNSSNSAIIEHAQSGKRHEIRDKALIAVSRHQRSTSSEIAEYVLSADGQKCDGLAVIDIVRASIRVASVQKRVSDLLKLGYIAEFSRRKCRVTAQVVAVYELTKAGFNYLHNNGLSSSHNKHLPAKQAVYVAQDKTIGFAALKASMDALR